MPAESLNISTLVILNGDFLSSVLLGCDWRRDIGCYRSKTQQNGVLPTCMLGFTGFKCVICEYCQMVKLLSVGDCDIMIVMYWWNCIDRGHCSVTYWWNSIDCGHCSVTYWWNSIDRGHCSTQRRTCPVATTNPCN